jgi:O-antigen/teichoic acid export membrane protein
LSKIRATYSGLISLIVSIITVFTGLVFSLIITRTLSVDDYGTWNLILGILMYAIIIDPLISYWITRETARTEDSQKTAIFGSGLLSVGGMIIFLITVLIVTDESFVNIQIVTLGFILVPGMFLHRVLYAINLGWKPHLSSYGLLISEVTKVPTVLILIYFFDMGVLGVIITFFIAQIFSIVFQIYVLRNKIRGKIQIKYIRKWLKLSWLTLYSPLSNLVYRTDILIFTVFSESVTGLAIFAVANVIGSLITIANSITIPTYAKLLAMDKENYLKENLTLMLFFAIPLGSISIVFARPALFALNPVYEGAVLIVIVMVFKGFLSSLTNIFQQYVWGNEKIDINSNVNVKGFLKSTIFKIPTVKIIDYSGYLILLIIGLTVLKQNSASELDYVLYWAIISATIQIPLVLYLGNQVKKQLKLTVDVKRLSKYVLTGIGVFGTIFVFTEKFLVYNDSIFEFLPHLLLFVGISVIGYIMISYIIDKRIRNLVNAIIQEIK